MKTLKQVYIQEASMYDFLYKKHKGVFYRGVGRNGKGTGLGAIGKGVYLSWSEGVGATITPAS